MRVRLAIIFLCCGLAIGCGTTRWTDTSRTATEQLLIADSIDRAVSRIDFHVVAGKKVFVDTTALKSVNDSGYLISSIRQQVLANGGILKDVKEKADYILEVRAGAVGTDRHDMLVGVPALSLPTVTPTVAAPTQIPEIPLVKKTNQRAIAKIALFVYNRTTGRMVWQSGVVPEESQARALWVFGCRPLPTRVNLQRDHVRRRPPPYPPDRPGTGWPKCIRLCGRAGILRRAQRRCWR